jgi:hypothetical protein
MNILSSAAGCESGQAERPGLGGNQAPGTYLARCNGRAAGWEPGVGGGASGPGTTSEGDGR